MNNTNEPKEPTMINAIISEIHKYNCEVEVLMCLQEWIVDQGERLFYNSISEFELGKISQSERIRESRKNTQFDKEVERSFIKYCRADFSEMSQEDIESNKSAIANGDDRIFGAYNTSLGKIYIITEHDRSCTTILFADEY